MEGTWGSGFDNERPAATEESAIRIIHTVTHHRSGVLSSATQFQCIVSAQSDEMTQVSLPWASGPPEAGGMNARTNAR